MASRLDNQIDLLTNSARNCLVEQPAGQCAALPHPHVARGI